MPHERWNYEQAFCRNLGLIDEREQQILREAKVAIAGAGGVGGIHAVTLARMGIGRFTIADPDVFETVNFNRQYGATCRNVNQNKARVIGSEVRAINPEATVGEFPCSLRAVNIAWFLHDAAVVLDGLYFFAMNARRLLYQEARRRKIWVIAAGPVGFSAAWVAFDPEGISFDEYFGLHDDMHRLDMLVAFAVGMAPAATHASYFDFSRVNIEARSAPSSGAACALCAGVAAVATAKIILKRGDVRPAPCYQQFDAYRGVFRQGRLRWGNRGWLQRVKRAVLAERLRRLAAAQARSTGK